MVNLKKISDVEWEIPKDENMLVPGKIFASEKLIVDMQKDNALNQIKNVSMLPGIIKASIAMPDCHQGYGFPIGGVAAFDLEKGVISPGGVGYDINCSVRLLKTNLTKKDILSKRKELLENLNRTIPSGVGRGSKFQMTRDELKKILQGGSKYLVEKGEIETKC